MKYLIRLLSGISRTRTAAALALTLCLSASSLGAAVETNGTTFTAANGNFRVELRTDGAEMLRMAHRDGPDGAWQPYELNVFGVTHSLSDTTEAHVPTISHTELGSHLIVKYSIRHDGLYWNFWFDLDANADNLKVSRFIYGETKPLNLNGVGVVFALPGYTATSGMHTYTVDGVNHDGAWLDFQQGTNGLRILLDRADKTTFANTTDGKVVWYRRTARDDTAFATKIDYKVFTIVPYTVGDSLAAYDKYMQEFVFQRPMSNVELVSNWITRSRRTDGSMRDWFNEAHNQNGFYEGTAPADAARASGFWRDDWTTGGVMRQLRDSYWITGDVFYLMRLADITDYQLNRDEGHLTCLWGIRGAWNENYLMGRPDAMFDLAAISGWDYYSDMAVASVEWFYEVEEWTPAGVYILHGSNGNINDIGYSFEGIYRANAKLGYALQSKADAWFDYLEDTTYNASAQLYMAKLSSNRHWSRGMGWWMEIFSNVYPYYQGTNKAELMDHYVKASNKLLTFQQGIWRKFVDEAPSSSNFLDSSGGTMIASGFARSFVVGDLTELHLESAMKSIAYCTTELLQSDGTIIWTDRGNNNQSLDPFPYTQEGYVKFAQVLGIKEIVELAARDTLYTTFNEGVFIVDDAGGVVTDSEGSELEVDGQVIVRRYAKHGTERLDMELMGRGAREVVLPAFGPANTDFTVRNINMRKGVNSSSTATTGADGSLTLAVDLQGHHRVEVQAAGCDSPWCGYETVSGYAYDESFGWFYADFAPFAWTPDLGWLWVAPGQSFWDMWAWSYDDGGWIWTSSTYGDWIYHSKTNTWLRR